MKNILIIDDEVNVALLLSKFLTRNGFNVVTASNGATAFELLKKQPYNLVLCDYRLEDTDGREVLKRSVPNICKQVSSSSRVTQISKWRWN